MKVQHVEVNRQGQLFTIADQKASSEPYVSISILTYNSIQFITDAIDSVLCQQVNFPVEIIIGDDNSTDGTQNILKGYANRYPDVFKLYLHAVRGVGVPSLVNNKHNLSVCKGKYVAILDGDDMWIKDDKLLRQVDFLDAHPGHSGVASDGLCIGPTTNTTRFANFPERLGMDLTLKQFAETGVSGILPSAWMFRAEVILPLPQWYDEVFVGDLYLKTLSLQYGPCRIFASKDFFYRIHRESFSTHSLRTGKALLRIHDDRAHMMTVFPELADSKLFQYQQIERLIKGTAYAIKGSHFKLLKENLRRLPVSNPTMYKYVTQYLRKRFRKRIVNADLNN